MSLRMVLPNVCTLRNCKSSVFVNALRPYKRTNLNKSNVCITCSILSFRNEKLWELKEAGKWSLNLEERKKAVAELANYRNDDAVQALSEIKDTTAFEEIRQACMDAIMSARKNHVETPRIQVKKTLVHSDRPAAKKKARNAKKIFKKKKKVGVKTLV